MSGFLSKLITRLYKECEFYMDEKDIISQEKKVLVNSELSKLKDYHGKLKEIALKNSPNNKDDIEYIEWELIRCINKIKDIV